MKQVLQGNKVQLVKKVLEDNKGNKEKWGKLDKKVRKVILDKKVKRVL